MSENLPPKNLSGAVNEQGSPTEVDLAWVAGHFDGDGWIGIMRSKRTGSSSQIRYTAAAVVSTTSDRIRDNLVRILRELGVTHHVTEFAPREQKRSDGTVSHHRRKWNVCVQSNAGALAFLTTIRPYLVEKGKQADIVIDYVTWRQSKPHRTGAAQPLIRELKEKAEDAMRLLREDRQRDDPSTTTRLAPADTAG